MIGEIVKQFVPEQGLAIVQSVNRYEKSVQQGVEEVFGLIPSSQFPEIQAFTQANVHIREGFEAFVAMCKHHHWPITVVSGGFDFFVKHALQPVQDDVHIVCNTLDTQHEMLRVQWAVTCDGQCEGGCGLCKPTVMRNVNKQPGVFTVVIGDGVTDLKAAMQADYVFARDRLLHECIQQAIPHASFDTFTDICHQLQTMVSEG